MGRKADKALVAWVVLALALAFSASPWRLLSSAEAVQDGELSAASQSQQGEEELPSTPCDEPSENLVDLFEDDEVVHDKRVFALAGLRLKLPPVMQFEPDSLHASQLDRPPLRRA